VPRYRQRETPPRYKHPDGCCTYVGQYGPYDVYFCAQAMPPTVILRCGDEPTDYKTRDWMDIAEWAAPEVK